MAMNRNERNALHKKQEKGKISEGVPDKSDLKNDAISFRLTNEGLVLYIKHNDVLYKKALDKG